ncbi:hypothetical protein HDU96_007397 [Phlyctochytrium bullatum]|nr:hypothetical protein HDU96_007397 [Phlyctochytrium bullatum]
MDLGKGRIAKSLDDFLEMTDTSDDLSSLAAAPPPRRAGIASRNPITSSATPGSSLLLAAAKHSASNQRQQQSTAAVTAPSRTSPPRRPIPSTTGAGGLGSMLEDEDDDFDLDDDPVHDDSYASSHRSPRRRQPVYRPHQALEDDDDDKDSAASSSAGGWDASSVGASEHGYATARPATFPNRMTGSITPSSVQTDGESSQASTPPPLPSDVGRPRSGSLRGRAAPTLGALTEVDPEPDDGVRVARVGVTAAKTGSDWRKGAKPALLRPASTLESDSEDDDQEGHRSSSVSSPRRAGTLGRDSASSHTASAAFLIPSTVPSTSKARPVPSAKSEYAANAPASSSSPPPPPPAAAALGAVSEPDSDNDRLEAAIEANKARLLAMRKRREDAAREKLEARQRKAAGPAAAAATKKSDYERMWGEETSGGGDGEVAGKKAWLKPKSAPAAAPVLGATTSASAGGRPVSAFATIGSTTAAVPVTVPAPPTVLSISTAADVDTELSGSLATESRADTSDPPSPAPAPRQSSLLRSNMLPTFTSLPAAAAAAAGVGITTALTSSPAPSAASPSRQATTSVLTTPPDSASPSPQPPSQQSPPKTGVPPAAKASGGGVLRFGGSVSASEGSEVEEVMEEMVDDEAAAADMDMEYEEDFERESSLGASSAAASRHGSVIGTAAAPGGVDGAASLGKKVLARSEDGSEDNPTFLSGFDASEEERRKVLGVKAAAGAGPPLRGSGGFGPTSDSSGALLAARKEESELDGYSMEFDEEDVSGSSAMASAGGAGDLSGSSSSVSGAISGPAIKKESVMAVPLIKIDEARSKEDLTDTGKSAPSAISGSKNDVPSAPANTMSTAQPKDALKSEKTPAAKEPSNAAASDLADVGSALASEDLKSFDGRASGPPDAVPSAEKNTAAAAVKDETTAIIPVRKTTIEEPMEAKKPSETATTAVAGGKSSELPGITPALAPSRRGSLTQSKAPPPLKQEHTSFSDFLAENPDIAAELEAARASVRGAEEGTKKEGVMTAEGGSLARKEVIEKIEAVEEVKKAVETSISTAGLEVAALKEHQTSTSDAGRQSEGKAPDSLDVKTDEALAEAAKLLALATQSSGTAPVAVPPPSTTTLRPSGGGSLEASTTMLSVEPFTTQPLPFPYHGMPIYGSHPPSHLPLPTSYPTPHAFMDPYSIAAAAGFRPPPWATMGPGSGPMSSPFYAGGAYAHPNSAAGIPPPRPASASRVDKTKKAAVLGRVNQRLFNAQTSRPASAPPIRAAAAAGPVRPPFYAGGKGVAPPVELPKVKRRPSPARSKSPGKETAEDKPVGSEAVASASEGVNESEKPPLSSGNGLGLEQRASPEPKGRIREPGLTSRHLVSLWLSDPEAALAAAAKSSNSAAAGVANAATAEKDSTLVTSGEAAANSVAPKIVGAGAALEPDVTIGSGSTFAVTAQQTSAEAPNEASAGLDPAFDDAVASMLQMIAKQRQEIERLTTDLTLSEAERAKLQEENAFLEKLREQEREAFLTSARLPGKANPGTPSAGAASGPVTGEDGQTITEVEKLKKEVLDQENLIRGYQTENEKLSEQNKQLRTQLKESERRFSLRVDALQRGLSAPRPGAVDGTPLPTGSGSSILPTTLSAGDSARLSVLAEDLERRLIAAQRDAADREASLNGEVAKLRAQLADAQTTINSFRGRSEEEVAAMKSKAEQDRGKLEALVVELESKLEREAQKLEMAYAEVEKRDAAMAAMDMSFESGVEMAEGSRRGRAGATSRRGGGMGQVKRGDPESRRIRELERTVTELQERLMRRNGGKVPAVALLEKPQSIIEEASYVRHLKDKVKRVEAEKDAIEVAWQAKLKALHAEATSLKDQYEKRLKEMQVQFDAVQTKSSQEHVKAMQEVATNSQTRILELEKQLETLLKAYETRLKEVTEESSATVEQRLVRKDELIGELNAQKAQMQAKEKLLIARVAELEAVIDSQASTLEALRQERAMAEKDLAKRLKERDTLVASYENRIAELRNEFHDKVFSTEEQRWMEELRALRVQVETLKGDNTTLKTQLEISEATRKAVHQNTIALLKQAQEDSAAIALTQQERALNMLREDAKAHATASLDVELKRLRSELVDAQMEMQKWKVKAEEGAAAKVAADRVPGLEQDLKISTEKCKRLEDRMDELLKEIERLDNLLKKARATWPPDRRRFEDLEITLQMTEDRLKTREAELQKLLEATQKTSSDELEAERKMFEEKLRERDAQIREFKEELDEIVEMMQELEKVNGEAGIPFPVRAPSTPSSLSPSLAELIAEVDPELKLRDLEMDDLDLDHQVAVGHPLDTVKVLLQLDGAARFKGTGICVHKSHAVIGPFDCILKTIKYEGVLGLYKGMAPPLIGVGFINAVLFSAYGCFKEVLRDPKQPDRPLKVRQLAAAGACAGLVNSFVAGPIELLKIRLQAQYTTDMAHGTHIKGPSNPLQIAHALIRDHGLVRGLFHGTWATVVREVPAYAGFYGGFEYTKRVLSSRSNPDMPLPTSRLMFAGAIR